MRKAGDMIEQDGVGHLNNYKGRLLEAGIGGSVSLEQRPDFGKAEPFALRPAVLESVDSGPGGVVERVGVFLFRRGPGAVGALVVQQERDPRADLRVGRGESEALQ